MSGGCLRPCLQVMRVLNQRVDHLREEEARLAKLCEERRKQSAPETGLAEGKLREVHVHWVTSVFTSRPVCDIWLFAAKGVVVQSCTCL